ncbi:hypothetical protein [Roseateles albus]|uniref:Uncharacterized protein n=1 Tax=Roseateles albus TaxID=2987525 RepID=A0ABT5KC13_9BURK|nr:hypothetical protein [Roseateles albus]MDC8770535.1 hypothetical protein [Roseateles albus]
MHPATLASQVINAAISELRTSAFPLFTFALYFDHESEALAVCADTEDNSNRTVASVNSYNAKYFHQYLAAGDLGMAKLWQANAGRSLSLGDFSRVNIARVESPGVEQSEEFFLILAQALAAHEEPILALSPTPSKVAFACSGVSAEVALMWSAKGDA